MKTICVVDDDRISIDIISISLEDKYNLIAFSDPIKAVKEITKGDFKCDLFLLDWMMPYISGIDLFHMIRTVYSSVIPIIMTTSKAMKSDLLRAEKEGLSKIICKPFNAEELLAAISEFI